jgi:hypothetical protein
MTRESILELHQNNNKVAANKQLHPHRIKQQLSANTHHLNRSTKTAAGAKQHLQNHRPSNESPPKQLSP